MEARLSRTTTARSATAGHTQRPLVRIQCAACEQDFSRASGDFTIDSARGFRIVQRRKIGSFLQTLLQRTNLHRRLINLDKVIAKVIALVYAGADPAARLVWEGEGQTRSFAQANLQFSILTTFTVVSWWGEGKRILPSTIFYPVHPPPLNPPVPVPVPVSMPGCE